MNIELNKYNADQVDVDRRVDIVFQNLFYSVMINKKDAQKKGEKEGEKVILNNINGICKNSEMTAILGASGAGKTSLLNILCRRIIKTNQNNLKGDIFANDTPYDDQTFSMIGAYVMQDDRLLEALTVKECLDFAANLRIKGSQEQKNKLVLNIIKDLQLERCLNTPIGGTFVKGISGGERKRTSIGFELVTDPQVIFLDEPTSGLDSFTAFLVMKQMCKFAHDKKRTVIFTIHQPSSDIWNLFDKIMLLVRGQLIYQGNGGQDIIQYFQQMGYNCPEDSNPADYYMSIMHHSNPENVLSFPKYYQTYSEKIVPQVEDQIKNKLILQIQKRGVQNSFCYELQQIAKRTIIQMKRNKILVKGRFAQNIILALFSGAIYYQIPTEVSQDVDINQRNIFNKLGFLFFACVGNFMSAMNPVVLTFPAERAVFLKEENAKLYRTSSYFFGRTMVEIPFMILIPIVWSLIVYWMIELNDHKTEYVVIFCFVMTLQSMVGNSLGIMGGSAFSDAKVAMGFIPMLMLPFMIFAGFYANRKKFADWIGWVEYLSPFKYSFEAVCWNEFTDTRLVPNPLQMLNFSLSIWECVGILIALFFGYRILALIFLQTLKKRLQ